MPYITFILSWDKEEDPGYLRFRICGLSNSQIKGQGPLHSLFERSKVTEFLGCRTIWIRMSNLGGETAPSLIGIRQEPAMEAIVPFFNQFEDWGYTMVGNSPQVTTATAPNGMDMNAMACTWIFHKSSAQDIPYTNSYQSSPESVKKLPMIPRPDY